MKSKRVAVKRKTSKAIKASAEGDFNYLAVVVCIDADGIPFVHTAYKCQPPYGVVVTVSAEALLGRIDAVIARAAKDNGVSAQDYDMQYAPSVHFLNLDSVHLVSL